MIIQSGVICLIVFTVIYSTHVKKESLKVRENMKRLRRADANLLYEVIIIYSF